MLIADSSMKTAISLKGAWEEVCTYSTGHLDEILSIQLHIMRGYYLVSEVLERCTDFVQRPEVGKRTRQARTMASFGFVFFFSLV